MPKLPSKDLISTSVFSELAFPTFKFKRTCFLSREYSKENMYVSTTSVGFEGSKYIEKITD